MALPIAAAIMGGAALGQGLISAFGGEKAAAISAEAAKACHSSGNASG